MSEKDKPASPSSGSGAANPAKSPVNTCPHSATHARVKIKRITYLDGHDINNDTLGDFKAPHWEEGRGADAAKQLPAAFPYCYERGVKIKLKPVFEVTQKPDASESVHVDGEVKLGANTLKFAGDVTVGPADSEVAGPDMTSDVDLPNIIAKYDPFEIEWFQTPCDMARASCGKSATPLYTTLGAPSLSKLYWTLLETSCGAAHRETTVAKLRELSYAEIESRAINRKRDGKGLTYWNPDTTTATNTRRLLSRADGSGQCGSWAEFLIDMWKAHGDTAAEKVEITAVTAASADWFLVKNWNFRGTAPATAKRYDYAVVMRGGTAPAPPALACIEQTGVPGQRNPNPPPAFGNHFIVVVGTDLYDPSYGSNVFTAPLDWENASVDGLIGGGQAGWEKGRLTGERIMRMQNLNSGSFF